MPNAIEEEPQNWPQVKSKIYGRFRTISACAKACDCTEEALRQSVKGKCPNVAKTLADVLKRTPLLRK